MYVDPDQRNVRVPGLVGGKMKKYTMAQVRLPASKFPEIAPKETMALSSLL